MNRSFGIAPFRGSIGTTRYFFADRQYRYRLHSKPTEKTRRYLTFADDSRYYFNVLSTLRTTTCRAKHDKKSCTNVSLKACMLIRYAPRPVQIIHWHLHCENTVVMVLSKKRGPPRDTDFNSHWFKGYLCSAMFHESIQTERMRQMTSPAMADSTESTSTLEASKYFFNRC